LQLTRLRIATKAARGPAQEKTPPDTKVVLNTVRVPLSAFGGVNLNNVRTVQLTFNERLASHFSNTSM
jgi:thiamine monophosphate synthase